MTIQSDPNIFLGDQSTPIEFPKGLIGLEEWQRFVIISHPAGEPLRLLQAVGDARFSLIVADPRQIISDYQLILTKADFQAIRYTGEPDRLPLDKTEIGVYCILSIQEEPFNVTANLLGPLVINWQSGLGQQVILSDSNYNPRYPITGQASSQASPDSAGEGGST